MNGSSGTQYYRGYTIRTNSDDYSLVFRNGRLCGTFVTGEEARDYIDDEPCHDIQKEPSLWCVKVMFEEDSRWYYVCNSGCKRIGCVKKSEVRLFRARNLAEQAFRQIRRHLNISEYKIEIYK